MDVKVLRVGKSNRMIDAAISAPPTAVPRAAVRRASCSRLERRSTARGCALVASRAGLRAASTEPPAPRARAFAKDAGDTSTWRTESTK